MSDTAEETGTLDQCLYSNLNRILIAQVLRSAGRDELLPTILEDLFTSCQSMLDKYCVKGECDGGSGVQM